MQRAMPSVLRALCAYGLGIKPILPETEVLQEISFSLGTTHSVHELLGEALDHPMEISPLTAEELEALENLYRTTKDVRLRTRAQIVLLAGEQRMTASTIAAIVREGDQT